MELLMTCTGNLNSCLGGFHNYFCFAFISFVLNTKYTLMLFTTIINWASSRENLSSGVCEQHRRRPACASAQSDQRLCYSLFWKYHITACYRINFNSLASLCSWGDWFETRLVGNPEDRFSRDEARYRLCLVLYLDKLCANVNCTFVLVLNACISTEPVREISNNVAFWHV